MADSNGSIQAQCHELLQELKTLRARESTVLERLVLLTVGSMVGDLEAGFGEALAQSKEDNIDIASEPADKDVVREESIPTFTPSMETLLSEAYGISSKSPEKRLPSSIWDRVKVCVASDSVHRATLLSIKPDQLLQIFGGKTPAADYEPYEICTSRSDWKYCKVLSRLDDYVWASAGHFPDYLPTWELRKRGNFWFHIDDTAYDFPFFNPWLTDEKSAQVAVPYSLVPPDSRGGALQDSGSGIPEILWDTIHSSLGTLFSVPPDARLQLSFEAGSLRQMHAANKHYRYLERMADFGKQLAEGGGELRVCDYSDVPSSKGIAFYEIQTMQVAAKKAEWDDVPMHRKAAWPALDNEAAGFIVPTTSVSMQRNEFGNWKVKTLPRSDTPPRPWYRIILLRGLSDAIGPDWKSEDVEALSDLLVNDEDRAKQTMIKSMLNSHVFCRRYKSSSYAFPTPWETVNITWHQIVESSGSIQSRSSSWKSGPLHTNELQNIQQRAFTVLYMPHDTGNLLEATNVTNVPDGYNHKYWTILLLTATTPHWIDDFKATKFSLVVVKLIAYGLKEAADAWDQVHPQFSSLIAENSPILDPRRHDRLMFDDDTFSRSRQYFWAMNSLEIFKGQIEDAVLEWTHFWNTTGSTIKVLAREEGASEDLEMLLRKANEHIRRLEERKAQFEAIIAKTQRLRDGLFNASAVIESRASAHLGENVQLLTYVSIFYLPISFCVAMWSINERYNRVYLLTAAILVASATYLAVANLKTAKRAVALTYSHVRDGILARMKGHDRWEGLAKRFAREFRPRRESDKPSEWNLLRFLVWSLGARMGLPLRGVLREVVSLPAMLGRTRRWNNGQQAVAGPEPLV